MAGMKKLNVAAIFVAALAATTLAEFSMDLENLQDEALPEEVPMEAKSVDLMPEDGPAPLSEDMLERTGGNSSSTTTVAPNDGCKDIYPDATRCQGWARAGYCSNRRYSSWMKLYCRKSCNNCKSCFDNNSYCSSYRRNGYCTRPSNFAYYQAYCAVSCGTCKVDPANCDDNFSSAICTKLNRWCTTKFVKNNCRKTCKACAQCSDSQYSTVCSTFKSAGYCTNNSTATRQLMTSNCRRTCELC